MIAGAPAGHFAGDVLDGSRLNKDLDPPNTVFTFGPTDGASDHINDFNTVLKYGTDAYYGSSPQTAVGVTNKPSAVFIYPDVILDALRDPSADIPLELDYYFYPPYEIGSRYAEPFFRPYFLREDKRFRGRRFTNKSRQS